MDIDARIRRRQRRKGGPQLIRDVDALSPVTHVNDPADRGPIFEGLLDHLDPVFDGNLPPNAYLHGPAGAGKSAVVTALFAHLERMSTETGAVIHTSTRAGSPTSPGFIYIDTRQSASPFSFYHDILDAIVEDPVPEHGVSTDRLRDQLHDQLGSAHAGVVIAVDHVGEPGSLDTERLVDLFAALPSSVSWLAVSRADPTEIPLTTYTATTIAVDQYREQTLVDLLMARASQGLAQQGLNYEQARQLSEWAEGNAHDGLAALYAAARRAEGAGQARLTDADIEDGMAAVPRPSVALGRILALPENKQRVLRVLSELDRTRRVSVTRTAERIGKGDALGLSVGTIERFLYEMAEAGIVERVPTDRSAAKGRPPSRLELRFPPTVFRHLTEGDR